MNDLTKVQLGEYNAKLVIVKNGAEFPFNLNNFKYSDKFDLDNMQYITEKEQGFDESTLPTLNELIANGDVLKKNYVDEYDIEPKGFSDNMRCSMKKFEKVVNRVLKEFNEQGFNVTEDALMHNYENWLYGFKSGYRDDANGYHLFTPCGGNPLSFRVSRLHPNFEDWQKTYWC